MNNAVDLFVHQAMMNSLFQHALNKPVNNTAEADSSPMFKLDSSTMFKHVNRKNKQSAFVRVYFVYTIIV